MTVYEAIKTMRELTKKGQPFSFKFMSYSIERQECHGIVEVSNARLRKRNSTANTQYAEIIEDYLDLDTNQPKRFYHPALMFFNGEKLTLR